MKKITKRSEMVKFMTEYHLGLFPNEDTEDPAVKLAVLSNMSRLLSQMKLVGMRPPSHVKPHKYRGDKLLQVEMSDAWEIE